ncbi:MAG: CGGC domain-containing protein [Pelosinus sp.]|nr:CGGC domain-containing protein [Pelosinus sp.]
MKAGLIHCMQTEDMCSGTTCFKVMKGRKLAVQERQFVVKQMKWTNSLSKYWCKLL